MQHTVLMIMIMISMKLIYAKRSDNDITTREDMIRLY